MSKDNWGEFHFEDTQPNSFLNLRNNIKERICRFLVDKKDLYQACLIHHQWTIAAQTVLWENAKFELPVNLRLFINTIENNNKTALLVKNVQLTFIDHDQDTPFAEIVKSKLPRHQLNSLADLTIITKLARLCENITSITIYGWKLGLQDIERLYADARNLKTLYIIGAPAKVPVNINALLPRLHTLRLDGVFGLTTTWAHSFTQKAVNLSCLQFSLQDIQPATLEAICSSSLNLTELTLTDAKHLPDEYVYKTLEAFPRLRRFRVEGCQQLTSVSLAHALMLCPDLLDLEIRATTPSNNTNHVENLVNALQNNESIIARPTRLVLQNLSITDEELHCLSKFFVHLKYLAISGCPELTNSCFEEFVENEDFKFLQRLSIQNCPLIDSNLFGLMIKSQEICQSLMRVYMESCGDMDLHDIHQLCFNCTNQNLREIKLVAYENLIDTVIGSFNENPSRKLLLLTSRSIDALAHSTDPVLTRSIPDDVVITGKQLVSLAHHLHMTVSELDNLISKIIKVCCRYTMLSNVEIFIQFLCFRTIKLQPDSLMVSLHILIEMYITKA